MRVISGKARGHTLRSPAGLDTRPTTDRVKEAIFNIIQTRLHDSLVIDIFAGSGSLGIEALSRNANKAYFIDKSRASRKAISDNLEKTNLVDRAEIICLDALMGIEKLGKKGIKAKIIFLDPPYSKGFIRATLEKIFSSNILMEDSIVILEHSKKDEVPNKIYNLVKYRTNTYGDVAVSFYQLEEETK